MEAHEMMKKPVIKLKEQDNVYTGIKKMLKYAISSLPVVNDRNEIIAMLRDEDIMEAIGKENEFVLGNFFFADVFKVQNKGFIERAQEILPLNVMEIAQKKVYAVKWNEKAENIVAAMVKKKIKVLPVIKNGVLVGIISYSDCIKAVFSSINNCLKTSIC